MESTGGPAEGGEAQEGVVEEADGKVGGIGGGGGLVMPWPVHALALPAWISVAREASLAGPVGGACCLDDKLVVVEVELAGGEGNGGHVHAHDGAGITQTGADGLGAVDNPGPGDSHGAGGESGAGTHDKGDPCR